ncbi:hypothetical protein DES38_103206 [Streptohalobacillus salinus]|uniref:Heat induced stress protein YflT n=1 Tax=Streptohalobacillus salinus TaxID=621096 RepID=A0A2V3WIC6_9BACI|nr:hypothetical protein [Streptohalobacillus salinus]PXW92187.1 hypothetical protein DES38_103206 [Streptohalobacillus salinus]
MAKDIQVYVHNEDEAEDLKTILAKYKTQDVKVDKLESEGSTTLVIPVPPTGSGGTGTGAMATANSNNRIGAFFETRETEDEERKTVLTFKVDETDYAAVLEDIRNAGGLVDKALFE